MSPARLDFAESFPRRAPVLPGFWRGIVFGALVGGLGWDLLIRFFVALG